MKIFLSGASGMVGRNILDNSHASNYDWLTPSHADVDLANFEAVIRYFEREKPDFVIHAAGKVGGIQANIKEPVAFLTANLDMGRNVLIAAAQAGVPRAINLGSSCMYPKDRTSGLREEDILTGPLEPTNEGYALAKVTTAKLAEYISRENPGLSYKTMIPSNLFGKYDKFDPRFSHLVPAVIHKIHQAVSQGVSSVEIWGDGSARREFLYAGDLAKAIFHAIENFSTMPDIVNIGVGSDYSVNEYYSTVAKVIGYQGSFVHDLTKPVGMARKLLSVERAHSWGWAASTTLEAGISETYDFYLKTARIN
ncbi:NAD dependent epimerase/dehydratase family protein [Bordetella hinzii 1277]|uniref:GDP-L-fucose synthase family protein n=1 Tax=Bordetella hinzii TaxID=103855 RepID=UPI000459D85F|nr:GDP-L-fucose synthase [Bordetella hinzii]KCB50152.1 NAD dependent epimerase/dehydratase family protein [Bordetella hinzii 1277]